MAAQRRNGRVSRSARQLARRILVVTEGTRTEPQYVEGLNQHLRSTGATTAVKTVSVGKDPLKVVEKCVEIRDEAKEKGKDYDICICLVDVDQHLTLDKACRVASRKSILLLISNLKFEVWLRWHVEEKLSALNTTQLDDLTAKLGLVTEKKLAHAFPFHAVHQACRIARKADPDLEDGRKGPNPSSAMPILVDIMEGRRRK